ncbi:MAG: hypothetical protein ABWX66_00105 [Lacisediminihabitans sp.]
MSAAEVTIERTRFGWMHAVVAVLFGLLFAFYFYEALAQTLELSGYIQTQNEVLRKAGGTELVFPWQVIGPLLALPFITYGLAFLLARRRPILAFAGIFVMALAVLSAGALTLESIAFQLTRIS